MKVLFICKGNWMRSQIAAALYNRLTHTNDADSAGTYVGAPEEPEGRVLAEIPGMSDLFEVIENHGLHIRSQKTKRLYPDMLQKFDMIISIVEESYQPQFLKEHPGVLWWDVENPKSVDTETAERIYFTIETFVRQLPGINRDFRWHGKPPKPEEGKKFLDELRTMSGKITSEHQ